MINPFFENKGPFNIEKLLKLSSITIKDKLESKKINDVKDLNSATKNDITFFHSKKYEYLASNTKASFCVTTSNLTKILPSM